ncbi:ribosomal protein S5 domain 2-type protein [Diplogelasinospora grovesii]|uniref:Ribosomal protein S5 domain 2-type protein n=1 Tax=Diplogelasinospora grovesii TaxID=303347 RepID=A0AAN6NG31_9PEZI|nr:ribosomal protein S5 domain 2-type protein [Diplogelasinospora grovesii]
MSEELQDEIEALNSIYGDGTLIPSPTDDPTSHIYILTLPTDSDHSFSESEIGTSLRIQFSAEYPNEPPTVLGTHSSGGARGTAARDLALFSEAVGEVYEPGTVCLFDALEKVKELREQHRPPSPPPHSQPSPEPEPESAVVLSQDEGTAVLGEEPPWITSDPVVELKSTFIARCAPVSSPTQAAQYVQHLLSVDKRVRSATHNITAWRIRGPNGISFQDCDDDGETAAGGRLLHLMQLMDLWDTMVIVTRWYGGQKLGPRRFALINAAARDAFVKAGLVHDPTAVPTGNNKKKHGK